MTCYLCRSVVDPTLIGAGIDSYSLHSVTYSCSWQFTVISFTHRDSDCYPGINHGNRHHKSLDGRLELGLGGQPPLSRRLHNPTTRFWPPSTTMFSLLHCTGSLRCLLEEMVTGWLWPVCLWRTINNVSRRRLLSIDKASWWLVQAALCKWWCCAWLGNCRVCTWQQHYTHDTLIFFGDNSSAEVTQEQCYGPGWLCIDDSDICLWH